MGSVGDSYDNAICDSFFATLECELPECQELKTKAEAQVACFAFIEGWYSPSRRHSALRCKPPISYERNTAESLESLRPQPFNKSRELQLHFDQVCRFEDQRWKRFVKLG